MKEPIRPTVAEAEYARLAARDNREHAEAIREADPEESALWAAAAAKGDAYAAAAMAVTTPHGATADGELLPNTEHEGEAWAEILLRTGTITRVNTEASRQRLELSTNTGSFSLAADAARAVKSKDPLEHMLIDQAAAFHKAAMSYLAEATQRSDLPNLERCRLANTAARLASVSHEAIGALMRKRAGGRQTVRVEHVTVNDGAALIGTIQAGGNGNGRPGSNVEK